MGGFGTVFKARQIHLDRVVALKVVQTDGELDSSVIERFVAEAITHGKLHHPNIVEVYDTGRFGNRMFIAMELLEGEDLGRRIQRCGALPERVAWGIARQTAAALAYAAASGLVHRDIKPANLFLSPAPSWIGLAPGVPLVRVTDFGLALTRLAGGQAHPQPPSTGRLLGTPLYMAPEQYRQPEDLDHRADIYALGTTLVHAITGLPPFEGTQLWEVMAQKLGRGPHFAEAIGPESAQLLATMTALDPKDRPNSYEELIARIDQLSFMRGDRLTACDAAYDTTSSFWKSSARRWLGRSLALVAAALLMAFVLGRDIWAGLRTQQDEGPPLSYVSTGESWMLFDGTSLGEWLPPTAGGIWQLSTDEESEPVLTGVGFTRRLFAPIDDYQLLLGVDVHDSVTTEVHFAIPAANPDTGVRFVIQISRSVGAVFGTRAGDKGEFKSSGDPVSYPPPGWFRDRRPYLEAAR